MKSLAAFLCALILVIVGGAIFLPNEKKMISKPRSSVYFMDENEDRNQYLVTIYHVSKKNRKAVIQELLKVRRDITLSEAIKLTRKLPQKVILQLTIDEIAYFEEKLTEYGAKVTINLL